MNCVSLTYHALILTGKVGQAEAKQCRIPCHSKKHALPTGCFFFFAIGEGRLLFALKLLLCAYLCVCVFFLLLVRWGGVVCVCVCSAG